MVGGEITCLDYLQQQSPPEVLVQMEGVKISQLPYFEMKVCIHSPICDEDNQSTSVKERSEF